VNGVPEVTVKPGGVSNSLMSAVPIIPSRKAPDWKLRDGVEMSRVFSPALLLVASVAVVTLETS
jgi:hypothetical protein